MKNNNANLGFLFQKLYYEGIDFDYKAEEKDRVNKANSEKFNKRNQELFSFNEIETESRDDASPWNYTFKLRTTYPGLLAGTGYMHETGMLGELKLGFSFDFTGGLPVIPGSSVKGVIKSCLKNECLAEEIIKEFKKQGVSFNQVEAEKIVLSFDNKSQSTYCCDVFFDATPVDISENSICADSSGNALNQKCLLGIDDLCHHQSLFNDPNPIAFMKVMPEVVFEFRFRIMGSDEEKKLKIEVFKQALLLSGAGAKTNVGYGRFVVHE